MSALERLRAWRDARVGSRPAFPFVVAGVFAVAMGLPALSVTGGSVYSGLDLLLEGWRGVRAGVFSWFANPLFFIALLLAIGDRRRTAGVASAVGCVLALTSFAAPAIARSRGVALPELEYASGFYVWLAAQLGLLAWCLAGGRPRQPGI